MSQSQAAQLKSQQTQQVHTQSNVKLEKTVNMMYSDAADRTRILYNLKNNRPGTQFLVNPTKLVNIVPLQQHKGGQGTSLVRRTIQLQWTMSNHLTYIFFRNFQFKVSLIKLYNALWCHRARANSWPTHFGNKPQVHPQLVCTNPAHFPIVFAKPKVIRLIVVVVLGVTDGGTLMSVGGSSGQVSGASTNSNNIIGSVVSGGTQGGTLIITTSSPQSDPSSIFNDISSTSITSTNANSINSNANNNQSLSMGNLSKAAVIDKSSDTRLNHNDGNAATINR